MIAANAGRLASMFGLPPLMVADTARAQDVKTASVTNDRGVKVEVPVQPKRIAAIAYFADDVAPALGIRRVAGTYMTGGRPIFSSF